MMGADLRLRLQCEGHAMGAANEVFRSATWLADPVTGRLDWTLGMSSTKGLSMSMSLASERGRRPA